MIAFPNWALVFLSFFVCVCDRQTDAQWLWTPDCHVSACIEPHRPQQGDGLSKGCVVEGVAMCLHIHAGSQGCFKLCLGYKFGTFRCLCSRGRQMSTLSLHFIIKCCHGTENRGWGRLGLNFMADCGIYYNTKIFLYLVSCSRPGDVVLVQWRCIYFIWWNLRKKTCERAGKDILAAPPVPAEPLQVIPPADPLILILILQVTRLSQALLLPALLQ